MRLYGVVVLFGGWCAWGALDFCVAMKLSLRGPCLGVSHHRRGFLRCQHLNCLTSSSYLQVFFWCVSISTNTARREDGADTKTPGVARGPRSNPGGTCRESWAEFA